MEVKNKLVVVGLMVAFANLGSVTAQAGRPDLDAQGEFVTIAAEHSGKINLFPHRSEIDSIVEISKEKLNEKATEACSGRDFSIDASSVNYTISYNSGPNDSRFRTVTVMTAARAFCIN